ncbi:MAG: hypothetical protein LBT75_00340 [Bacilli bacterium]|jgi:hypothetical protein|nr:hypothetical protein [Bacilli bacterium]
MNRKKTYNLNIKKYTRETLIEELQDKLADKFKGYQVINSNELDKINLDVINNATITEITLDADQPDFQEKLIEILDKLQNVSAELAIEPDDMN